MNKERSGHSLAIAEITMQMRLRDIVLVITVAGSLGYVTGAALPHLLFLEHINMALGVFVLFGMLFLVGFILLFFEPVLFPFRSYSSTSDDQSDAGNAEGINEDESDEGSIRIPAETPKEKHESKVKDTIKNIYTLQNEEIAKLGLTEQENIVVRLLLRGDTYKNIATQMFLSENTIKYHVHEVYQKAHVKSRQDLKELIWRNIITQKS